MTGAYAIPAKAVLLVEGGNDEHVVRHIHRRANSSLDFRITAKGDVDSLIASIPGEAREAGRRALGIAVDADDRPRRRWDAVLRRLRDAGMNDLPTHPDPEGTVIAGTRLAAAPPLPDIGIWLMPDNGSAGELEDFVQRMIPENDPVWPLSQRYIAGIPPGARKFPERKKAKAELYAWLATRREPGPMGRAVAARDLVVDGQLCQRFLAWTERLFR